MSTTPIFKLGTYVFDPPPKESLDFDMEREIAKLTPPGGSPVYQDMGMSEKTISFTGTLYAVDAWRVSEEIERMWWSGRELDLTYGDIHKRVRIKKYSPKLKRKDRVDYSISLIVCFPYNSHPDLENYFGGLYGGDDGGGQAATLQSTMDKEYTIKSGDTLWQLAVNTFGDGSKWGVIAQANGITNEYGLQVGQSIRIPSAGNASASASAAEAEQNAALGANGKAELQGLAAMVS
jgi:hypothetical protein